MTLEIRRAQPKDLNGILEIEEVSFSSPFSYSLFETELTLEIAHLYVAHQGNELVGYIDFWRIGWEVHLINIAISPRHRRTGIGTELMKFLIEGAKENAVGKIYLDVRRSNQPAISLYQKFGFETVGVRKEYYRDNDEDALVMSLALNHLRT